MSGLSPMEILLEEAVNGLGLFGAEDEQEEHDDDSQGEESEEVEEVDEDELEDESEGDDEDGKPDKGVEGLIKSRDKAIGEKRKAKNELAAAQARIRELEGGDKSESEQLTEATTTISSQEQTIRDLRLQNAFLVSSTHDWENPKLALSLADMDSVDFDDESGEVTGLKEALDEVASKHPYLIRTNKPKARRSGDPAKPKDEAARKKARESELRSKYKI